MVYIFYFLGDFCSFYSFFIYKVFCLDKLCFKIFWFLRYFEFFVFLEKDNFVFIFFDLI